MSRILGVNGILSHGEGNIDLLLGALAKHGHDVVDVRMPYRSFFSARWGADDDAELLAETAKDGDAVVCHSFGCLRTAYAMETVDFSAVFMFRPAMSRHYRFERPETVYCVHSRDDITIRLGARLLFHPFGVAGTKGFEQLGVHNTRSYGGHNQDFRHVG